MRVLPDLTQRRLKPQHTGKLTLVTRTLGPGERRAPKLVEGCLPVTRHARFKDVVTAKQFAHVQGVSKWSEVHTRPQRLASERQRPDQWPVARRAKPRSAGSPGARMYRPKDGAQSGPMFGIYDRVTGVRLASCRGVIHHVLSEAQKFAQAQGLTLADVEVKIDVE